MKNALWIAVTITVSLGIFFMYTYTISTIDAPKSVSVFINGEQLIINDTADNNNVHVPLGEIVEAMGSEMTWDEENNVIKIESSIKLAASIPEEEIYLYTFNVDRNKFEGVIVKHGSNSKVFSWHGLLYNVNQPQLFYHNSNLEGNEVLAVLLSDGSGTGILKQHIHLLELKELNELMLEDPRVIINENTVFNTVSPRIMEVKMGDDIITLDLDNIDFKLPNHPDAMTDDVFFEWYVKYEFNDKTNTIVAILAAEVEDAKYFGTFVVYYSFINGQYSANKIEFTSWFATEDRGLSKTIYH
jgi:hypothetical protein